MPTVVATCPYCRTGEVRAAAAGEDVACPKCRGHFVAPRPALEPGPAPAAEPPPPPSPEPAASAAADAGMVVALGALILVGPAVLATQLPYGRVVAGVLAAAGLVAGLLSLGAEGRARLAGAAALALHALLLVVVLLLPSWLGLESGRGPAPAEDGPGGVLAVPNDGGPARPADPDGVDGVAAAWVLGDTRVNVHGAFFGPVELAGPNGATRRTAESYLQVTVRVANVGTDRRVPLGGWAAGGPPDGVRLATAGGRVVKLKAFPAGWAPGRDRPAPPGLFPGKSTDALLVFEPPPPKAADFELELPGAAVGAAQPVRFRLPASFLGVRR